MSFESFFQRISSKVTIIRVTPDGETKRMEVDASIQATKAFFKIDADIEEGDYIERWLSMGKARTYQVKRVEYYEMPAHMAHVEAEIEPVVAIAAAERKQSPSPSPQPLRILYLTASPAGDLRVDQEMRRVKEAIRSATGRDLVVIEYLPAATNHDLLDGLTRFRPHVIHFSGHANDTVLTFDSGNDRPSVGKQIKAETFAAALSSVDDPPTVVVLNACNSEPHLNRLVGSALAAVGMSDRIDDEAAIAFAARLYAAIADGQSLRSAFQLAKVAMEMSGLPNADLPVLAHAPSVDPGALVLVSPGR